MNLILHIVRKDFLRLRGRLAIWLAVLAAKFGIGYGIVFGGNIYESTFADLQIVVTVLVTVELALTFLIMALLVHEDPLVGSQPYWMTRPISGGRLLAAKLLGAGLMLIVPAVAVSLPWWLVCGFNANQIAWAALDTVLWQIAVMAPALLAGVLTDSLSRLIVWTLVILAGQAMAWLAISVKTGVSSGFEEGVFMTRVVVDVVLVAGVIAAIAVHQYLTRRLVRSLVLLGGGLALALGVAVFWPWDLGPAPTWNQMRPEHNAALAESVKLEWLGAEGEAYRPTDDVRGDTIRARVNASNVPKEFSMMGGSMAQHTWRWPGNSEIVREGWTGANVGRESAVRSAFGFGEPKADEETQRWKRAHPVPVPAWNRPRFPATNTMSSVRVPHSVTVRLQREAPAYALKLGFVLLRPVPKIEMPLQPGGWQAHDGQGLRVMRFERKGEERWGENPPRDIASVSLVETEPLLGRNHLRMIWPSQWDWRWWWEGTSYSALNRAWGVLDCGRAGDSATVHLGSVDLRLRMMTVGAPKLMRGGQWVSVQPDAFEGAALALVGWREEACFHREVKVERFELVK